MKLSKLRNNPNNPRLMYDNDFGKLLNKILVYPRLLEKNKITYDGDDNNVVLGGNMRLKTLNYIVKEFANKDISEAIKNAQKALGIDSNDLLNESINIFSDVIDSKGIPNEWAQNAAGLTQEEKEAFIIIDNVSDGKWDFDLLANEWDIDLGEWNLPSFGVDGDGDGGNDNDNSEKEVKEDDFEVKDDVKTNIQLGDLFEFFGSDGQYHKLLCGDSTDKVTVEKLMDGKKADMVFTDPPYGYSYESNHYSKGNPFGMLKNDEKILDFIPSLLESTNEDCAVFICGSHQTIELWKLLLGEYDKLSYKNMIIWKKNNWSMGDLKGAFAGQYEIILFYHKGRIELIGKRDTDIWEFDRQKADVHPTQKPIPLISYAMQKTTQNKAVVLDFFLGSGSTMVASHQLNRNCYGMELEPKYCQVIVDRMMKLDDTLKVKINGSDYN